MATPVGKTTVPGVKITPLAAVGDGLLVPFNVSLVNTFPALAFPVVPLIGDGTVVSGLAVIDEALTTTVTVVELQLVGFNFSQMVYGTV